MSSKFRIRRIGKTYYLRLCHDVQCEEILYCTNAEVRGLSYRVRGVRVKVDPFSESRELCLNDEVIRVKLGRLS